MKWKSSSSAAENAWAVLPKMADDYFDAGRKAADGKRSSKELHRFRVATKRFRYALELFRPVYGPSLDRHLQALRGLQDSLGKVSDCQTIQLMLARDEALQARLQRTMKRKLKEFRRDWRAFDSGGEHKRWKTYLSRGRRRAPASERRTVEKPAIRPGA
jgi:CHAD domain-containing protein